MAKKKRHAKTLLPNIQKKQSLSYSAQVSIESSTQAAIDNPAVRKFVERWMSFYAESLYDVYFRAFHTLTSKGWEVIPREDGRIIWTLVICTAVAVKWTHLNMLAANNPHITVTEIDIRDDIEVSFVVDW